jgi:hypothetical protein
LRVLGDETRLGASQLPIDRWMLDRIEGRAGARHMPPVAWHGRFMEPELAVALASPAPVTAQRATPLPPAPEMTQATMPIAPDDLASSVAPTPAPVAPAGDRELRWGRAEAGPDEARVEASDDHGDAAPNDTSDEPPTPGVVDALALDLYTTPVSPVTEAMLAAPAPAAAGTTDPDDMSFSPMTNAAEQAITDAAFAPVVPTAAPETTVAAESATAADDEEVARPLLHNQLDPEVRKLVEELYEQARAEMRAENGEATE